MSKQIILDKGKALELKYLKCNYLGNKKPEIELKN